MICRRLTERVARFRLRYIRPLGERHVPFFAAVMFAFGCGPPTLTVVETDPFDAAQRRIESNAHRALVERAQILLQSSQPNLDELQHLSEQLKQELMESRVSKAGIEPKSRRRMEAALSDIAHRVSMHPIVPTQSIEINWAFQAGQPSFSWPLKHVRIVFHFGLRTRSLRE